MANVKVALRVRPLSKRENAEGAKIILTVDENVAQIRNVKLDHKQDGCGDSRERLMEFGFDYCYWSVDTDDPKYASQEVVFQDLGTSILSEAISGYNVCLFAYGQTGSGKTYTMMGTPTSVGLTPRICEGLFSCNDGASERASSCRIEVSFMEIYNERVRDLLDQSVQKKPYTLRVREHPEKGPYVQGLSQHEVTNYEQVVALLEEGMENRITAATHIHDASSRSHAIFTIQYTQATLEDNLPSEITSKMNLVDLAGSERASPTYCKDRLTEGSNINRSLVTLGIVISALAQNSQMTSSCQSINSIASDWDTGSPVSPNGASANGSKRQPYIPYRDSILTWLLKDSLGGNSKTVMIATVSPSSISYNETISTLRYASNAKNIINKPRVNEDANVKLIRNLREEINRLKLMLRSFETRTSSPSLSEEKEGNLSELVLENELKIEKLTKDWTDKWMDKANIMDQYKVDINQGKAGFTIDPNLPHLIAMDDDILSTGVVIYHLREGATEIGRDDSDRDQDIVLQGEWMEKEHCVIVNNNGVVELRPIPGALCTVNGKEVTDACRLSQGAVIVLGKTHRFRFNHPAEAAILRQQRSDSQASFLSSGSLDWLDLSGSFSTSSKESSLILNTSRETDPLNTEYEQKLRNLEVFYQQRYVQDLKKQIHAAQIKGEKELEQEQSLINQQIIENQQWLVKEEQLWTTVHQQRQESAVQTDSKTYAEAEVQNSVQTEGSQPSPAEQDRKRLVQLELLRKCSLRRAERNIKRKRVKYQLEWIAKKQKLLEAKKNLQQLQAVCWASEDTIKQTLPHAPDTQESNELSALRRSRSSPPEFTYHRGGSLPRSLPRLLPYSSLLKRKGKSDLVAHKNGKPFEACQPRRSTSVECLSKTLCDCSKNEPLTAKPNNKAEVSNHLADKNTLGSSGNLNREVGICSCPTILISNPQMSKKRPKMDKAGNSTKKVPNNRLTESPKTRPTRVPVQQTTRDTKPKSLKTAIQRPAVTLKNNTVQEKRKVLQKNEAPKSNTERSPKNMKQVLSTPRPVVRHSPPKDKSANHLKDTTLEIKRKLPADGDEKVLSSVDNLHKLSTSATIDRKWKSTEIVKPTTDLLGYWKEDDESASSDSESFYSVDSLSSAYASALNKQLKMEELEENKSMADHKNSDSEDSQMSQDSLIEKEKQKQKPNKRGLHKCKTAVKTPISYETSPGRSQDPAPVMVTGSVASGLSRSFSVDSLADTDDMCEADSEEEFPAEIFWKLESPRLSTLQTQNQNQADTTEESNDSTLEFNTSFFLNVNPEFLFDKEDTSLDKTMETCLRMSRNVSDDTSEPLDGTNHITGACSSLESQNQDCALEAVEIQVGEVRKSVKPSSPSLPKCVSKCKGRDSKSISDEDTFVADDFQHSPPFPVALTTQILQDVKPLRVKNDHGSVGTPELQSVNLQSQNPKLGLKAPKMLTSVNLGHMCDISVIESNSDFTDLNDSDIKFQWATEQTSGDLPGFSEGKQVDPKNDNRKTEVNDFDQKPFKNCESESTTCEGIQEVVNTSEDIENLASSADIQRAGEENMHSSPENCAEKNENVFLKTCKEPVPSPLVINSVIMNKPKSTTLLTTEKPQKASVCHGFACNEMPADVTVLDQEKSEFGTSLVMLGNHEMCHRIANAPADVFDQNENISKTKLAYGFVANLNYSLVSHDSSCFGSSQSSVEKFESQNCQKIPEEIPESMPPLCNKVEITGSKNALHYSVPCDQAKVTFPSPPSISTIKPDINYKRECKDDELHSKTEKVTGLDFDNDSESNVPRQTLNKHNETPTNTSVCVLSDSEAHMFRKPITSKEDRTVSLHRDEIRDSLEMDSSSLSVTKSSVMDSLHECHSDHYSCAEKNDPISRQAIGVSGGGMCDGLSQPQQSEHNISRNKTVIENDDKELIIPDNASFNHNENCNKLLDHSAIPCKTVDSNGNPEGQSCCLEVEKRMDKTEEATFFTSKCILSTGHTIKCLHPDSVYVEGKHVATDSIEKNSGKVNRQTDAEGADIKYFSNERKDVICKDSYALENSRKAIFSNPLQQEDTSPSISRVHEVAGVDTVLTFLGVEPLNADNGKSRPKCSRVPEKMSVSICTKNKHPRLGTEPEARSKETSRLDQTKQLYMESKLNSLSFNLTNKSNLNSLYSTVVGDQGDFPHGATCIDGSLRCQLLRSDDGKESNGMQCNRIEDLKNHNLENPKSSLGADNQPLISGGNGIFHALLHYPENTVCHSDCVSVATTDNRTNYARYKLKNNSDVASAVCHDDSSEINENVYFGVNVTSGSLPGKDDCSALHVLENVSGASLVLPYYEAILQQQICIEGKANKGKTIISGLCTNRDILKEESYSRRRIEINLPTELPTTNLAPSNNLHVSCTNDGHRAKNCSASSASEFIMKQEIGPLTLFCAESEPNSVYKIGFSNGNPGILENSDVSAESSTCKVYTASLSQEGFSTMNTSENSQNGHKTGDKPTYIHSKSEESGLFWDSEKGLLNSSRLDDHSQPEGTHRRHAEESHVSHKLTEHLMDKQSVSSQNHDHLVEKEHHKEGDNEHKQKPACPLQECGIQYSSDMACSTLHVSVTDQFPTAAPMPAHPCRFPNSEVVKHEKTSSVEKNRIAQETSCVNTYSNNLVTSDSEKTAHKLSISSHETSLRSSQSNVCEEDVGTFTQFVHTGNTHVPIVINMYDEKLERKLNDLQETDAHVLDLAHVLGKDESIGVQTINPSSVLAKHKPNDMTEGDAIVNVSCEQYVPDETYAANECTQVLSFLISDNSLPIENQSLKMGGFIGNDGDMSVVVGGSSDGGRNLIMPADPTKEVTKDHSTYLKVECKIPEQHTEYSFSPTLISSTNATNCEPAQSSFSVSVESIKPPHMESQPDCSGVNKESSNPSVPCIMPDESRCIQNSNMSRSLPMEPILRPPSATITEDIWSDGTLAANECSTNVPSNIKTDSDGIQEFLYQSLNASVDKEGLRFSSSDINPFVHPWHLEENGKVSWKPYAFNSVSDVSSMRYPTRLDTEKITRCTSVDEGLNTHNLPFHSHLSSYANARMISSTLSSIEDQHAVHTSTQERKNSSCSLDDSQYYYPPTGNMDFIKHDSETPLGDQYTLKLKPENDSEQVDEIVLLYTSESETCDENDLRLSWELGQARGRHRRINLHQRSRTDETSVKPNSRNQYPRPASWSSVQDMSMHLSQLLYETSELLGNLSQHQPESFHIDINSLQRGSAGLAVTRTLQDSSTQTTVDIAVQTDPKVDIESRNRFSDKQGKGHNGLLNAPEINVIVKVIGTETAIQSPQNSQLAARQNKRVVPKTQSLPDLQDLSSRGESEKRLCHSAHARVSTPFLARSHNGTSDTTSSPISSGSYVSTTVAGDTENPPCSDMHSGSSTTQSAGHHSGHKSHLKKSTHKSTGQDDSLMVDRATSPILTRRASKKPLDNLFQEKDFTSQNIVKLLRHRRTRDHNTHEPQVDNSSQTETDSESGRFQGNFRVLSKSEHRNSFSLRESTGNRMSRGNKLVPGFGSEDCITSGVQPVVFTRSRSISDVSGVGNLSTEVNCFSLRRRDKADGTSATALNSQYNNVTSAPWERPQSLENLSKTSDQVKNKTIQTLFNVRHKEHCSDLLDHTYKEHCNEDLEPTSYTAKSNSLFKNTSYPFSEMSGFDLNLQEDAKSVAESECNTDILLNLDSSNRLGHKTLNYSLQDLPLHNKFSNWSGVQGICSRKGSLTRSSVDLSVRESPTKSEVSPTCESRSREIERLQKERAEIMSGIHLELNLQPLTVQLAEAKLSYGIGETDALLRVIQDGKFDGQDTVSIKKQLYDRHMKAIESLRKEREDRLQSFRRSRSLSPQKQLSLSQGSLTSLRDSDLPSRRREYLQQLRKDVVDSTRILEPKRASHCPSEIEFMLKDYQKAREEAKTEIARARDKLRERAVQEKKRLQSQPKEDIKLKTLTSTSTLFTNSSLSLSSGPTSGYNSSITATYGKSCKLGNAQETKTSPRNTDIPSVSTRGRSAGRNSHLLPSFQKPRTPVSAVPAKRSLAMESAPGAGHFPYTSPPTSSLASYQEFSRLVQENATAEVMTSCGGDLKNLFLSRSSSGWRFQCVDRDVHVYYKAFPSSTTHGFLGAGVIKRPLHDVWCMVKDIGTRRLYDTTILSAKAQQSVSGGIQLVHVVSDVSLCYLKQPRDFCCISVESKEEEGYSLCFQSLYEETMPRPSKDTVRGEILPSAWMLRADSINGETVTRVVYMVQVDLGAPMIPTRLLPAIAKRQPLVIASLAKFLSK